MAPFLPKLVSKAKPEDRAHLILPIHKQIKAWQKANRKMAWGIKGEEFETIEEPPPLTESDRHQGFIGPVLFYGFGFDAQGNADPVLSGKTVWEYALKYMRSKTWQCEYIHFDMPDYFRLRPGAPPRPRGFYYAKLQPGERYQLLTVSQTRKLLRGDTGCGPEGIQLLAVTHNHFQRLMNEGKIPFIALADYDVAPYGFSDFFDAPQIFVRDNVLALGIGNIDNNYPLFGIPTLRFPNRTEAN